jgi:hypothetical protein
MSQHVKSFTKTSTWLWFHSAFYSFGHANIHIHSLQMQFNNDLFSASWLDLSEAHLSYRLRIIGLVSKV